MIWWRSREHEANIPSQTEQLFHTYSQFSSLSNIPPKPTDEERETEAKIDEILEKVGAHNACGALGRVRSFPVRPLADMANVYSAPTSSPS